MHSDYPAKPSLLKTPQSRYRFLVCSMTFFLDICQCHRTISRIALVESCGTVIASGFKPKNMIISRIDHVVIANI